MGSACSVPAARARWIGKSRRCEGAELASGKGELASQHSANLGTLSKADSTLLGLGLFQEEEWASSILASIQFLHLFFCSGEAERGKAGLFAYLHALVLLHSPELLSFNPSVYGITNRGKNIFKLGS